MLSGPVDQGLCCPTRTTVFHRSCHHPRSSRTMTFLPLVGTPGSCSCSMRTCRRLTNYQAEQALRTPIVNRKVFGGNRTDAGCRAQEIISSTIQTCTQQQRSALAFLRDAVCGVVASILRAASPPALACLSVRHLTYRAGNQIPWGCVYLRHGETPARRARDDSVVCSRPSGWRCGTKIT